MAIKEDASKILTWIYNQKVDGKSFVNLLQISTALGLENQRIINAFGFLEEEGYIEARVKTLGKYENGLPIRDMIKLTSKGINLIKDEEDLKSVFPKINFNLKNGHIIINQAGQNSQIGVSAPIINNSHISSGRDSYVGSTIQHQHIKDNSRKYTINKSNNKFIENMSIELIKRFGERKLTTIGFISTIAGILSAFSSLKSLFPSLFAQNLWTFLPTFSFNFGIIFITLGIILIFIGSFLIRIVNYKYYSGCKKCKTFYALEEIEDPQVTDVPTHEGIRRSISRKYKCKKCGEIYPITNNYLIEKEKKY